MSAIVVVAGFDRIGVLASHSVTAGPPVLRAQGS
jgi:hypothetical protein